MRAMYREVATPIDVNAPLDVWLRFADPEDYPGLTEDELDESEYEANTFLNEDNTYRVEWYHTAVGQVSSKWFLTYAEATAWLEDVGYQDFSS